MAPAVRGVEAQAAGGERRRHEEDQQRAHAVVAEALPHLGEEERGQAARVAEERCDRRLSRGVTHTETTDGGLRIVHGSASHLHLRNGPPALRPGLARGVAATRRVGRASAWTRPKQRLRDEEAADADLVGFHLPMHTATRLAASNHQARIRARQPGAARCAPTDYTPRSTPAGCVARHRQSIRRRVRAGSSTSWAGDGTRRTGAACRPAAAGFRQPGQQQGHRDPLGPIQFLVPDRAGSRRCRSTPRCRCPAVGDGWSATRRRRAAASTTAAIARSCQSTRAIPRRSAGRRDGGHRRAGGVGRGAHHVRRSRFLQRPDPRDEGRRGAAPRRIPGSATT